MIIQILPKFFILYLLEMLFLIYYNTWKLFKIKKKLFIYILIIKVLFFLFNIKIMELVFNGLNFKILENLITF